MTTDGGDYYGNAVIRVGADSYAVTLRVGGRFEPIDGRYHWGGRIAAHADIASHVRAGQRSATVQVDDGEPVPARLGATDPWGGIRITGVGRPPHWSSPEPRT